MVFLTFTPRLAPEKLIAEVVAEVRGAPFTVVRLPLPKLRVWVATSAEFALVWVTFNWPLRRSSAPMVSEYTVVALAVLVTVMLPPLEMMLALLDTRFTRASEALVLVSVSVPPLRLIVVEAAIAPAAPLSARVPALMVVAPV